MRRSRQERRSPPYSVLANSFRSGDHTKISVDGAVTIFEWSSLSPAGNRRRTNRAGVVPESPLTPTAMCAGSIPSNALFSSSQCLAPSAIVSGDMVRPAVKSGYRMRLRRSLALLGVCPTRMTHLLRVPTDGTWPRRALLASHPSCPGQRCAHGERRKTAGGQSELPSASLGQEAYRCHATSRSRHGFMT